MKKLSELEFGFSDAENYKRPENRALPNSSYITNTYDPVARLLTTLLKTSGGTTLDAAEYGYNVGNQRTTFTNAAGTHVSYTYDNISQLTVAASSTSSENRGYLYDAAWNLNRLTNNGISTTYAVNSRNELTVAGVLAYYSDANGNVTNRVATSGTNIILIYGYDDENRLSSVQENVTGTPTSLTTFVYDGVGRLRKQFLFNNTGDDGVSWSLTGGTYYIYDGKRVIQERYTNNTPTVAYTRGNDLSGTLEGAGGIGGLLARSDSYSSGSFANHDYYHADGNGNITYLETSSQTLAASYRYDPFGNVTSSSGTFASANTYRFSSKEYIPSVGIYYYLYRFYDPGAQRWLNRDPIEEDGGLNLYSSVQNNPVQFIDSFGLYCEAERAAVQAADATRRAALQAWRDAESRVAKDTAITGTTLTGTIVGVGVGIKGKNPLTCIGGLILGGAGTVGFLVSDHYLDLAIQDAIDKQKALFAADVALNNAMRAYKACQRKNAPFKPPLVQ